MPRNSVIVTGSSIYHYRQRQLNVMVSKGTCINIWTICSKITTHIGNLYKDSPCILFQFADDLDNMKLLLQGLINKMLYCKKKTTKAVFKIEVSISVYVWYTNSCRVNSIRLWFCTTCTRKISKMNY